MKAILEYDISDPDQADAHRAALDGQSWKLVCQEMDDWLRQKIKYGEGDIKWAEEARKELRDEIADRGLNLE